MNENAISSLITNFLIKNNKSNLFLEQQAVTLWNQIVGEFIAKQTTKISVKNGVIYAIIPLAALRFEVMNCRSQIILKMNQHLGAEVIKNIIIK